MNNIEEKILNFLKERDAPVRVAQLVRMLELGRRGKTEVRQRMKKMIREGRVLKGRGQTYRLPRESPVMEGTFSLARDGYGFVAVAKGADVFVPARDVGGAMEGDRVRVTVVREDRGRRVGTVEEILERGVERVVGVLEQGRSGLFVDIQERAFSGRIYIVPEGLNGAEEGDQVGIAITEYSGDDSDVYEGRVSKLFTGDNIINNDIDKTVFSHKLRDEFPGEVLHELESFSDQVMESDLEGRTDLRDKPFVTIDGEDARDFDDALCLERLEGGGRRIYVAIADVSHYVQPDTAVDREALERGTSVYFPIRVLPMLPEKLSNGLCSLRPDEDRLALTLRIDLDKRGGVLETELLSTVIRSHARLTYTQVQRLFDGEKKELPPKNLHEMLMDLKAVGDRLFAERLKDGSIDLELPEARLIFDEELKHIEDIVSRLRTRATGLVEELMLLANRLVATEFMEREFPCVYRVHEEPNPTKVETFMEVARATLPMGVIKKKMNLHQVQTAIGEQEDSGKKQVLGIFLLRALQRAHYSTEGNGHHGLGFESYLHFTSPIRRYPDLVVHRLVRGHLLGKVRPPARPERLRDDLEKIATHTSEAEQRSVKAEREVAATLKVRFMERHLGKVFDGLLTSMSGGGFFIRLGDYPVDGFLPVDALPEGQYYFDPDRMVVTADEDRKTWRLGDTIQVQVVRTDIASRQIELGLPESGSF